MTKVADMIPVDGRDLAASIERMLGENIPSCDKELSMKLFDSIVDKKELLQAWGHLSSLHRAAYKYWVSRGTE